MEARREPKYAKVKTSSAVANYNKFSDVKHSKWSKRSGTDI